MDQLRFATIGSSKITQNFIDGTRISKKMLHSAVYSRTYEQGEMFSRANGNVPVYTSLEKLAESDIEAIYVASPNKFHYEQSKFMLEHGKHVICEKSISAQPEQVKELVEIAKEHNVIFMEALMFMHLPSKNILSDALSEIGEIKSVNINFCQRSSRYDAYRNGELPNIFDPKCETGALLDLGVYCVYPSVYFWGRPKRVEATSSFLSSGVDGTGSVIFDYGDKLVTLNYSKLCQGMVPSQFVGDEGCVTVDSISTLENINIYDTKGNKRHLWDGESKEKLMSHEAGDFAEFVRNAEDNKRYYDFCTDIMISVSELMYEIRMKSGLYYPSDKINK